MITLGDATNLAVFANPLPNRSRSALLLYVQQFGQGASNFTDFAAGYFLIRCHHLLLVVDD